MSEKGMYVSPVARRVASLTGHVIVFEANKPVFVPQQIRKELLEYGILPLDGDLPIEVEEKVEAAPVPRDEREAKIDGAIERIVEENDPANFTASGVPRLPAVKKMTGFDDITSNELKDRWLENRRNATR